MYTAIHCLTRPWRAPGAVSGGVGHFMVYWHVLTTPLSKGLLIDIVRDHREHNYQGLRHIADTFHDTGHWEVVLSLIKVLISTIASVRDKIS